MTNRLLELEPKGLFGDRAIVTSFSGREAISQPFEFFVELDSTFLDLTPAKVIGQPIAIRLDRGEQGERFFHGYVSHLWLGEINKTDSDNLKFRTYRIRMVPWIWFMSRAARSFIYLPEKLEKSLDDVFKELVSRVASYGHVKSWNNTDKAKLLLSRKLEHCVQYRETDFNFLCRTLEQYGIFFYFKHEKDKHTMFMSDLGSYDDAVEATVEFPTNAGRQKLIDYITSWEHSYEFVSGKFAHTDYDFIRPAQNLHTDKDRHGYVSLNNNSNYELYDYPGEFTKEGDGAEEVNRRLQEEEARFDKTLGTSTCKTFSAGFKFALADHHSSKDQLDQYLITEISHSASQPGPFSSAATLAAYTNHFECIPAKVQYRPKRLTPKPIISGIQTATVAGDSGNEIHTDKYGRIKVHFHWDRAGRDKRFSEGDKICCWVRVAYPSAGKDWGFVAIPRVGQEVIVEFIEGDPDQPVVTGTIYNGTQTQHYKLPEHKSRSYWKTNSTMGGEGYNELMFEDKKDDERVYIHAEKNMDLRTKNDTKQITLGEHHHIVGAKAGNDQNNYNQLIYNDHYITIKHDKFSQIDGNVTQQIGNGDMSDGGVLEYIIEKKEMKTVGPDGKHLAVEGDCNTKVGKGYSLDVGGDMHIKVAGACQIESGAMGETHIKAGTIVLEGMMQVSLKVGGNFIDISPAGISIQGMMLNLNSGGAPAPGQPCGPTEPEAPAKPDIPEAKIAWDSKTGSKSRP